MALVKSSISKSEFDFSLSIADCEQFNTPPLIVGDVPWIIFFSRNEINNESLSVCLMCDYQSENDEWWIEAEGHLTIRSSKEDKTPIEINLQTKKYMASNRMSKCERIKYEDIVSGGNGYIQNGMFTVECTIATRPMVIERCPLSRAVTCTSKQIIMRVENVDSMGTVSSSKFSLRGINWTVKFQKSADSLAVHLHKDYSEQDMALSVKVACEVKLLSFNELVNSYKQKFEYTFAPELKQGFGWTVFMGWNTFIDKDKHYVKDNKAFFDITIKVGPWKPIWQRQSLLHNRSALPACPICFNQFDSGDIVATTCGHLFCDGCIQSSIRLNPNCPLCKNVVTEDGFRKIYFHSC